MEADNMKHQNLLGCRKSGFALEHFSKGTSWNNTEVKQ